MNALVAAVIRLESSGERLPQYHASAARSWFLQQVEAVRPDLLPALVSSTEGNELKPYTLSGILSGGGSLYLRITALADSVAEAVVHDLLPRLPESLTLGQDGFRVIGATTDAAQHPAAGTASYTQLVTAAQAGELPRRFNFQLVTPLSFRSEGMDVPLPEPARFYGSLLRRWETFIGEAIPLPVEAFFRRNIVIDRYRLHTTRWREMGSRIGCLGQVAFALRRDADDWRYQASVVQMLSAYAFYSGVGVQTTYGMGQVRPTQD